MQSRAALAVLEDLVRQLRFVLHRPKAVLEEEVGNPRKQANGLDAVLFSLFDQCAKNPSAGALSFRFRLHHDRAYLAEMRPVEVQRAATKKHPTIRLRDREVADVLADLCKRALEQRSIAREGIDEIV